MVPRFCAAGEHFKETTFRTWPCAAPQSYVSDFEDDHPAADPEAVGKLDEKLRRRRRLTPIRMIETRSR